MMQLIVGILLMFVAASANAEVYKWADESGKIHFSDQPPAKSAAEKVDLQVNSYTNQSVASPVTKKIVMYSAAWCGVCKKARRFFRKNNIAFQEHDVENSAKGRRDFKKYKGKGVPLILIGTERMTGFTVAGFRKLYERDS